MHVITHRLQPRPVSIFRNWPLLLAVAAAIIIALGVSRLILGNSGGTSGTPVPVNQAVPGSTGSSNPGQLCADEQNIIRAARTVGPSVITVVNYRVPPGSTEARRAGLGSGIIVRNDGYIITNQHVVADADRVEVVLTGTTDSIRAQVLGGDPRIDIAILKIPRTGLPVAPLGDSDVLQVGQQAIAIGNPLGFERTVTVGVVSALNRVIPGGGASLRDLVETDASINPGNSGGPLLNSCGLVIGVNTAVVSSGEGGPGLGFAVPINVAQRALRDVLRVGRVVVPWMGISYGELTPEMARAFRLPVSEGVIVGDIAPGSPAAAAGVQRGDIVVQIGDTKVTEPADIEKFIREAQVGQSVGLTVVRDSSRRTMTLRLTEMPRNLSVQ